MLKEPLIIEDLFLDERTKNFQKLEAYSSLRFYAGSPLVTSKGYSIGTLCVLGTEPKKITHDQIEGLRIMADLVVSSIENDFLKKQDNGKKKRLFNQNESTVKYFSTSKSCSRISLASQSLLKSSKREISSILTVFFKGFETCQKVMQKGEDHRRLLHVRFGIPKQEKEHALKMCAFALDMLKFVEGINSSTRSLGETYLEITHRNSFRSFDSQLSNRCIRCLGRFREHCS